MLYLKLALFSCQSAHFPRPVSKIGTFSHVRMGCSLEKHQGNDGLQGGLLQEQWDTQQQSSFRR